MGLFDLLDEEEQEPTSGFSTYKPRALREAEASGESPSAKPLESGFTTYGVNRAVKESSLTDYAGVMLNEFSKSYGLRRDVNTGEWSFNFQNVVDAWTEHPVFTALDYAAFLVPAGKIGLAFGKFAAGARLLRLSEETGAVGTAALKALNTLKNEKGFFAIKALSENEFGAGGAKAMEILGRGEGFLKDPLQSLANYGEVLTNPETRGAFKQARLAYGNSGGVFRRGGNLGAQEQSALHKFADGTEDIKTSKEVFNREHKMSLMANETESQIAVGLRYKKWLGTKTVDRLTEMDDTVLKETGQKTEAYVEGLLKKGGKLGDDAIFQRMHPADRKAYEMSQAYSDTVHATSFRQGDITEEKFIEQLPDKAKTLWAATRGDILDGGTATRPIAADKMPLFNDFLRMVKQDIGGMMYRPDVVEKYFEGAPRKMKAAAVTGIGHLMPKKGTKETVSNSLGVIQARLMTVRSRQAAIDIFDKIADNSAAALTPEKLIARGHKNAAGELIDTVEKAHAFFKDENWGTAAGIARESVGKGFGENQLARLENVFIDPAMAKDLLGAGKMFGNLGRTYAQIQNIFRTSKTILNPATYVRNILGNQLFQGFITGNAFDFRHTFNGFAELSNKGEPFMRYMSRGGIKATLNDENKAMIDGFVRSGLSQGMFEQVEKGQITLAAALSKEAAGAGADLSMWDKFYKKYEAATVGPGNAYGGTDEAAKMGAFLYAEKKYQKQLMKSAGLTGKVPNELVEKAADMAFSDVNKFMQQFTEMNPLMELAKQHVPFISFTAEAARILRNAIIEKPLTVFAYNHMFEEISNMAGMVSGVDPREMETAQQMLPPYMDGKKTMMLPWRNDEGKLQFLDMSYVMPMADLGAEAADSQSMFLGISVPNSLNPLKLLTRNPIGGTIAAAATGVDPFSGRPIQPNVFESFAPAEAGKARSAIGIAEYMTKAMLPPLLPPGYAGVNLWEAAMGRKSGITGEELEKGVALTVAANVFAFRTYSPEARNIMQRMFKTEDEFESNLKIHRENYQAAWANDDTQSMAEARDRIVSIYDAQHGDGRGMAYFQKERHKWQPGSMRQSSFSSKKLLDVIKEGREGGLSSEELQPFGRRLSEIRRGQRRR